MSLDMLLADLQAKYPEEVYSQLITVDIAMTCQSDSECREILGTGRLWEMDDETIARQCAITMRLALVAHPYLMGWRSTTVRRALTWSASNESELVVPSSSTRECERVTQGEP